MVMMLKICHVSSCTAIDTCLLLSLSQPVHSPRLPPDCSSEGLTPAPGLEVLGGLCHDSSHDISLSAADCPNACEGHV